MGSSYILCGKDTACISPTKSFLLFCPSGPTTTVHDFSQYLVLMQLISNIISHKPGSSEFSDPTDIGGILIPFSPLWRMFLFSPSGPATTVTSSNQYMFQTANAQDNLTQSRYTEVPSLQIYCSLRTKP